MRDDNTLAGPAPAAADDDEVGGWAADAADSSADSEECLVDSEAFLRLAVSRGEAADMENRGDNGVSEAAAAGSTVGV